MAELHITEYQGIGQDCMGNSVQVAQGERGRQTLTISTTPAISRAVRGPLVRLFATAPCRIAFGPDPAPGPESIPIAVGVPEYFHVPPGHKVAVVARD